MHTLPVSWRLPATAAPVVSAAFYPFTGFSAATEDGDRAHDGGTRDRSGNTLLTLPCETAADSGWALYELGHRHTLRTDAEAVAACAGLAARLLLARRGHDLGAGAEPRPVTADRIAIGVTRTVQAAARAARRCASSA